jgi:hypothetical protein
MGLDRFSANYKPPKVEQRKLSDVELREALKEAQKETKRKDREFEKMKLQGMADEFVSSTRSYKQPLLEFPLVPWGKSMRYDIPTEQREAVINSLDVFKRESVSLYNGVYKDIHSGKTVKGSELEVIREGDFNWVVSSHYNESGGTLIHLMPLEETII